jgi:uncharacterized protein YecE (DUF72 family)
MLADARVGTSGFAYREWVGSIYPSGLTPAQMLSYYASQLATVEIASRLPTAETIAAWAQSVPPGFQFATRIPGRIDLRQARASARALEALLDALEPLGEHLGPVLVQVPQSVPADRHALLEFLRAVPSGVRLAFEFRHSSWAVEPTLRMLSAHNAALVLTDHGEGPPRIELTADFAYVRIRHEDEAPEAWSAWTERLAALVRRGIDVYAYLKHDRRGVALERARRLAMLLGEQESNYAQQLLT